MVRTSREPPVGINLIGRLRLGCRKRGKFNIACLVVLAPAAMDVRRLEEWEAIRSKKQARLTANFVNNEFCITNDGQVLCTLCHCLLMNFHAALRHSTMPLHQTRLDEMICPKSKRSKPDDNEPIESDGEDGTETRSDEMHDADGIEANVGQIYELQEISSNDRGTLIRPFMPMSELHTDSQFEINQPIDEYRQISNEQISEEQIEFNIKEFDKEIESDVLDEETPAFLSLHDAKQRAIQKFIKSVPTNSPQKFTLSDAIDQLEDEYRFP